MKSLFIRVLAVLFFSLVVVALTSSLVFRWISHEIEPRHRHFQNLSRHVAHQLVEAYERDDLGEFNQRLRHRHKGNFWILDSNGRSLIDRRPPPEILAQIVQYPMIVYPNQNTTGESFLYAHELRGKRGDYRVIMASRYPLMPPRNRLLFVGLPVLAVLAALIGSSAMLAFWILRPVRAIRNTAVELSEDNLDAQVPDSVTGRKDAFGELGREFNRMSRRVRQAVFSRNELLRDVSHELRSPLNRIQVAASLVAQKSGDQEELSRIQDEVERLNSLIEDLFSLTKLKNDMRINQEAVDIRLLISGLLKDANYEFQESDRRGLLADGPEAWTWGNRDLLYRLFENIIRNGLRYTPAGETLLIDCEPDDVRIRTTVTDNGPGVDPESLALIFEPFYRADTARDTSSGHHGIGLALAKTIAELHDGAVTARNLEKNGFQVSVVLPAYRG